jgi:hypothetical protein
VSAPPNVHGSRDELLEEARALSSTPVTSATLAETTLGAARHTKQYVLGLLGPRDTRLDALERRVADLEARPVGVQYDGTWSESAKYARRRRVSRFDLDRAQRVDRPAARYGGDLATSPFEPVAMRGTDDDRGRGAPES